MKSPMNSQRFLDQYSFGLQYVVILCILGFPWKKCHIFIYLMPPCKWLRPLHYDQANGARVFRALRQKRVRLQRACGVHFASLFIWEFPKIGDPNIVPYIVGSLS